MEKGPSGRSYHQKVFNAEMLGLAVAKLASLQLAVNRRHSTLSTYKLWNCAPSFRDPVLHYIISAGEQRDKLGSCVSEGGE